MPVELTEEDHDSNLMMEQSLRAEREGEYDIYRMVPFDRGSAS